MKNSKGLIGIVLAFNAGYLVRMSVGFDVIFAIGCVLNFCAVIVLFSGE